MSGHWREGRGRGRAHPVRSGGRGRGRLQATVGDCNGGSSRRDIPKGGHGSGNARLIIDNFTSPNRSRALQTQHDMRRFVSALLAYLPQDDALVLRALGDPDHRGLSQLKEICSRDFTHQAGAANDLVSFQRVVAPMLLLVTQPRFSNSTLASFRVPVLATINTHLPLERVRLCVEVMAKAGTVQEIYFGQTEADSALWRPATWYDVMQPVADLLRVTSELLRTDEPSKVQQRRALLDSLAAAADSFEPGPTKSPGHKKFIRTVRDQLWALMDADQRHAALERRLDRHAATERRVTRLQSRLRAAAEGPFQPGPGELRPEGPRHDNDKVDIADIQLAPTQQEVLSNHPPFLPQNRLGSLPHKPPGSLSGHCELHFRLYREDLVSGLSTAALAFSAAGGLRALQARGTQGQRGGRFLARSGQYEVDMFAYHNARVECLTFTRHAGAFFQVSFDQLPHLRTKKAEERRQFWKASKRLKHGTLVSLWQEERSNGGNHQPKIIFAVVVDRSEDGLAPKPMQGQDQDPSERPRIGLRLPGSSSAEVDDWLRAALQGNNYRGNGHSDLVLLQSQGSFFAYAPVLKALQKAQLPLAKCIVYPASDEAAKEANRPEVPAYLNHGTNFDLTNLIDPTKAAAADRSMVNVWRAQISAVDLTQADTFPSAALEALTTLDRAQVAAVKAALTQEMTLIQGPPGTGKTHVGLQIVRAILANTKHKDNASGVGGQQRPVEGLGRFVPQDAEDEAPPDADKAFVGPLICLCYTNHALDQFLMELHKSGTTNIVRIGSRCNEPALEARTLRSLAMGTQTGNRTDRQLAWGYRTAMESIEEAKGSINQCLATNSLDWGDARELLYNLEADELVSSLLSRGIPDADGFGMKFDGQSCWRHWLRGPPRDDGNAVANTAAARQAGMPLPAYGGRFDAIAGTQDENDILAMLTNLSASEVQAPAPLVQPQRPIDRNRAIEELLQCEDAWSMSRQERIRLKNHLLDLMKDTWFADLKRQMERYEETRDKLQQVNDHRDLDILRSASVVGLTTSGLADKQRLIAALAPKIVVVEEAAEILEAHALAGLPPSVEQFLQIGDDLQLRPKAEQYKLTVESGNGYNLTLSLFERLRQQGFPVQMLLSQHRMQPAISELVRSTVYPDLQDHPSVQSHARVRGLARDVFFWAHDHPEAGANDESKSKYNSAEAEMAVRLVRHLMMQGYKPGDVVILTPYVGQLLCLRKLLKRYMTVVLSDRDLEDLPEEDEQQEEADGAAGLQRVPATQNLSDAVRVASIDNFQGEEAKVIVISTVRNNKDGAIGFLKSRNRVNVMLSRARNGMFILGHPDTLMARTKSTDIWPQVLDILNERGCISEALPLRCQNHPDGDNIAIRSAADFDVWAPDGGCNLQCTYRLPCGHQCPRSCHVDDKGHVTARCRQPCQRLHDCGHACPLLCYQPCGNCHVPMDGVALPCGHVANGIPCARAKQPEHVECQQACTLTMEYCGHVITVRCHNARRVKRSPRLCDYPCKAVLQCGHPCPGKCGDCLKATQATADNVEGSLPAKPEYKHRQCQQKCGRELPCGHMCGVECSKHGGLANHCPPCSARCEAKCSHSKCGGACSDPCTACAEPCTWSCPHQGECQLPCGAPCDRLPCNMQCPRKLPCGHPCPGVCGEPCPPRVHCITCGKLKRKVEVYDAILDENKLLADFTAEELKGDPLLFLTCGHVFPMSTLDGLLQLQICYARSDSGAWSAPLQLQASEVGQPVASCMQCRAPISGVARYGRPLKRRAVELAERKFAAISGKRLEDADADMNMLRVSAETLAATTGMAADHAKGLKDFRKQSKSVLDKLKQLVDLNQQSPSLKVYAATSAMLQRLKNDGRLAGDASIEEHLHAALSRPDLTRATKARISLGKALTLCMAFEANYVRLVPTHQRKAAWLLVEAKWEEAKRVLIEAFREALESKATFTAVRAKLALAALMQQRTRDLQIQLSYDLQAVLGAKPGQDKQTKAVQEQLLERSQDLAEQSLTELHDFSDRPSPATAAAKAEAERLIAQVPNIREWVKKQDTVLSKEEQLAVIRALVASDPSLRGGGWGGSHQMRCPNGHVYFIGDCGGAMEVSRCIECGAAVGGRSHRLLPGNTVGPMID